LLGESDERIRFAYDMGFALEPFPPPDPRVTEWLGDLKRQGVLVGLNVSGLLYSGGYGRADYFRGRTDYRELVRRLIEYLAGKQQAQVLLLPHVFSAKSSVAGEFGDNSACDEVFQLMAANYPGRLHRLDGSFDQHEIKYVIGRCDFFLGARMHACIAALSQCIPCISFAYSKKFLGVMQSIGADDLVVDLMQGNIEQAMHKTDSIFCARAEHQEKLQRTIPAVKENVLSLFKDLQPA
jgi:polysaccharide pyruvyl transferase WcaK-like protein